MGIGYVRDVAAPTSPRESETANNLRLWFECVDVRATRARRVLAGAGSGFDSWDT